MNLARLAIAFVRCACAVLLAGAVSAAFAQATTPAFDHLKTGFALTGTHTAQRCESCHLLGLFKGTPRDCASCHTAGARLARSNVVKPDRHIPTLLGCDSCHGTQSFAGAKFNHAGVPAGTCMTCHAAGIATAKSAGHVVTSASCDACHRTSAWQPASGFNHAGVVAGTCATCHGVTAKGKTALHIATTVPTSMPSCDSCHRSGFTAFAPAKFHASVGAVVAQCASCHTGSSPPAVGKPNTPVHANVTACEVCHRTTTTWAGAKIDHSGFNAATSCAGCHDGRTATGKSTTHVVTGGGCESCHTSALSTRSWLGARFDHNTVTPATICTSCHTGSGATGKPMTHMPVATTNCYSCHVTTAWRPASKWTHAQVVVTAKCSTCHTGSFPPADGRSATHIPHQSVTASANANCDTCHVISTVWTGARFHSKVAVAAQCATCHTGAFPPARGKGTSALHATVTSCEGCHRSNASWASATSAHTAATAVGSGTCDGCHGVAGTATTKAKPTHVPVPAGTAKCDSCHRSQANWATAVTMNHALVTAATCKSCHSGGHLTEGVVGALAKPANHIPETQLLNGAAMDCKACHSGTTVWTTIRMNHNASLGGGSGWCKGCHTSGQSFLGNMDKKSLTHERKTPLQIDCSESGCHRPLGNKGSAYGGWD